MATYRLVIVFLITATSGIPGLRIRVESRNGSIYYIAADGIEERITDGRADDDPAVSVDGGEIVFVRSWPAADAGDERVRSELHVYNLRQHHDDIILQAPIIIDGTKYFGFGSPQFSPDASRVYFLFNWSVATHGLAEVSVATHRVRFIMPAMSFSVVSYGKYAGDLVVKQRRSKLSLGTYTLYYLFTPRGQEIGVVGETEFDVGLFLNPDGDER
jgi:hypothetical protein